MTRSATSPAFFLEVHGERTPRSQRELATGTQPTGQYLSVGADTVQALAPGVILGARPSCAVTEMHKRSSFHEIVSPVIGVILTVLYYPRDKFKPLICIVVEPHFAASFAYINIHG